MDTLGMPTDAELREGIKRATDWLLVPAYLLLASWTGFWASWGGYESWTKCFHAFAFLVGAPWVVIGWSLIAFTFRRWKAVVAGLALVACLVIFVMPYLPERRFLDAYDSIRMGTSEAGLSRTMKPASNVVFENHSWQPERTFGFSNSDGDTEIYATFTLKNGVVIEKQFEFGD
jgi:hypothetical protein